MRKRYSQEGERYDSGPLLRQFLRSLLILNAAFGVVLSVVAVVEHSLTFSVETVLVLALLGANVVSLRLLHAGRLEAAATVSGYALLGIAIATAPLLSFDYAGLVVAIVAAVAVVLPYLGKRRLFVFLVASLIAAVLVPAIAILRPHGMEEAPSFLRHMLTLLGVAAATYLVILLLFQSSRRLRELLVSLAASKERAQLLADASRVLAEAPDTDSALQAMVDLAASRLSDLCATFVEIKDGTPLIRSAACVEAEALPGILALVRAHMPDIERVIASRKSEILLGFKDRPLDMRSALAVPLVAGGHVMGAIFCASRHILQPPDLLLAEEIARRSALALDRARLYEEARDAVAARDEFLSVASHELKTPLTSLELQVSALTRASRNGSLETQAPARLPVVARQVDRLTGLVDDLLDVSRLAAGRFTMEPEKLDLKDVTEEIASRFREQAARVGSDVRVEAEPGCTGEWDRLRVEQIVTNLLSNAIKYGRGRPIVVKVHSRGAQMVLDVEDHGIGIKPEDQSRIFERFERAVEKRNYGGLGLGLWIVKQIVRAMGGTISLQSEPGKGSLFEVVLPRSTPALAG